jgi:hypothetical protein
MRQNQPFVLTDFDYHDKCRSRRVTNWNWNGPNFTA